VKLLEKKRVHELAKELNGTSKRLIEKLNEIGIEVRNHMSVLDGDQVKMLYKHIGVVIPDGTKQESPKPEKKIATGVNAAPKRDKNEPRIIRKTEIIINTEEETKKEVKKKPSKGGRGKYVKVAESNSGLRAGYVRDNKNSYSNLVAQAQENKKVNETKKSESNNKIAESNNALAEKSLKEKDTAIANAKKLEETKNHEIKETTKKATGIESKNTSPQKVEKRQETLKKPDTAQTSRSSRDTNYSNKASNVKNVSNEKADKKNEFKNNNSSRKESGNKGMINQKSSNRTGTSSNRTGASSDRTGTSSNRTGPNGQNSENKGSFNKSSVKTQDNKSNFKSTESNKSKKNDIGHSKKDGSKDIKSNTSVNQKSPLEKGRDFKPRLGAFSQKKKIGEDIGDINDNDFIGKKRKKKHKGRKKYVVTDQSNSYIPPKAVLKEITIGEVLTVKELSEGLKKTSSEVIKKLMALGVMATINQEVDFETATLIADEFGIKTNKKVEVNEEELLFDEAEVVEDLEARPPVVVVMGHVDHGKTSLLDAIREENVFESEAGGITQHIGAYTVRINNRDITFLDTPGHEAFTAMRSRGAQVTDVAILVVAADDGVMPQTIEAINHAKAAGITIIVAINKMDKPESNPDKVKQELTEYGLVAEEWGGDTICVPVSAKNKENLDTLLEMVLLSADMLELKASKKQQAKGTVIEAQLDKDKRYSCNYVSSKRCIKTWRFPSCWNMYG
jgi:translation initiation factor IF-2